MVPTSQNRLKKTAEILIMCTADIMLLLFLFWASLLIRTHILPMLYAGFPSEPPFKNSINLVWLLAVWLFFFHYEGLYTKRFSFWDEIEVLLKASFLSTAGIFIIISIGKMGGEISRTLIVFMGILTVLILPLVRIFIKRLLRRFGILSRRVLILGASDAGRRIAQALKKEPNYGYIVIGFIDDDPDKTGRNIDHVKVHRGLDRILTYIRQCKITDIIIALPDADKDKIRHLINTLQHKVERVLFVPDMLGVVAVETSLVHFFHEQVFAFEIQNNLSRPFNVFLKRGFDLLVGSAVLLLLALPLLTIALLIKLDSSGSVLFKHQRVGRNGAPFGCYKFRTMYADAADRLKELLSKDPAARKEWDAVFKLKNDPRVTRVGKILRATSLDELPQLFNVIRGEMSIVGPRPVIQEEIDKYYMGMAELCFSVLPGVTGLWQVSGRNDTSYDYRIAFDAWYVKNWNLWLDIVIIFKTVKAVLKREGAY